MAKTTDRLVFASSVSIISNEDKPYNNMYHLRLRPLQIEVWKTYKIIPTTIDQIFHIIIYYDNCFYYYVLPTLFFTCKYIFINTTHF